MSNWPAACETKHTHTHTAYRSWYGTVSQPFSIGHGSVVGEGRGHGSVEIKIHVFLIQTLVFLLLFSDRPTFINCISGRRWIHKCTKSLRVHHLSHFWDANFPVHVYHHGLLRHCVYAWVSSEPWVCRRKNKPLKKHSKRPWTRWWTKTTEMPEPFQRVCLGLLIVGC